MGSRHMWLPKILPHSSSHPSTGARQRGGTYWTFYTRGGLLWRVAIWQASQEDAAELGGLVSGASRACGGAIGVSKLSRNAVEALGGTTAVGVGASQAGIAGGRTDVAEESLRALLASWGVGDFAVAARSYS